MQQLALMWLSEWRSKSEEEEVFICHIHNYTEYNQQWNVFSAFNPSKCTHTWSSGQPGSSWGCLAQASHLSRGQFLPEPRFEPKTSVYKSNALSIRPRLPLMDILFLFTVLQIKVCEWKCGVAWSSEWSLYIHQYGSLTLLRIWERAIHVAE